MGGPGAPNRSAEQVR